MDKLLDRASSTFAFKDFSHGLMDLRDDFSVCPLPLPPSRPTSSYMSNTDKRMLSVKTTLRSIRSVQTVKVEVGPLMICVSVIVGASESLTMQPTVRVVFGP